MPPISRKIRAKPDLVAWIQAEAAAGQALNLNAVARRRPGLLKAAFSGRSPRGWYRSLRDAGVNPYKIVHEHEAEVQCPICGYSVCCLGSHLLGRHGLEKKDYPDELGNDVELCSEAYRAHKFRALPIYGIKHWEEIWSKYYVIDWILRLHDEGRKLNFAAMIHHGKPLTYHALRLFGSWDEALSAAGLNPEQERLMSVGRQWTSKDAIQALKKFAVLKKKNPRLTMPFDLSNAVRRKLGGIANAVKAAGLKREDVSCYAVFLDSEIEQLLESIRKLKELKGITRIKRLKAIHQKDKATRGIIQGHYQNSLQVLAKKEGINPHLILSRRYRDKDDVMHDLDLIERSGMALNYRSLKAKHSHLYNVIIRTGWGRNRLVNE